MSRYTLTKPLKNALSKSNITESSVFEAIRLGSREEVSRNGKTATLIYGNGLVVVVDDERNLILGVTPQ